MTSTRILENKFQIVLKKRIREILPGAIVLKNDPTFLQGVPDLLILYKNKWAALECKRAADAPTRPNQNYYICRMATMSFGAIVYPENIDEVLKQLEVFMRNDV